MLILSYVPFFYNNDGVSLQGRKASIYSFFVELLV